MNMNKKEIENIYFSLCEDIKRCHGNITKMKALYKTTTDQASIFYNSCLSDCMKTRELELNYKGENDIIYI